MTTARPHEDAIGVFDSGLGGLTVVQALVDLLPREDVVYIGDTARYPYGPRSGEELQRFSLELGGWLVDRGARMVVVACNSATAAALDLLRERLSVPVIGVVEPGVRAAVAASATGRVAVIGTEMTVRSGVYERVASALRTSLELRTQACPALVGLVEEGRTAGPATRSAVRASLGAVVEDVDTLVLGCTHFPLLARAISDVVGPGVTLVSSADETAFEVRDILLRTGLARRHGDGRRTFLTSGDPTTFATLGERFLGWPLDTVGTWALPTV